MKPIKLVLMISLLCLFMPKVNAESVSAMVNGDEVRFRSSATTDGNYMSELNSGTIVYLNSTTKVSGTGCTAGWYSVNYNNTNGYICSSFISLTISSVSYGRPWTTPKKAIMGGAEFIASDYIALGQNTSYYKRFNVSPNSYYEKYNHLYMTNISAPYSEAYTSYKSYRDNGLLSLPLVFEIPIYNNMPEYTVYPGTGNREAGGTSTITDQAFEAKLDQEGFPETYKVWLRALHNTYSNWTFKSAKTGLDFDSSVNVEQTVSYVQSTSCSKCVDSSWTLKEGSTWYLASKETVAYFMDPRNFLMADSVLMFEDLGYSDNYSESVVQSVLAGTFMSGCDNIDKISYSSMFMEAGKTYNVSPVYLASLSKQEVGTSLGTVTSGNEFTYEGNTYVGFYNFYNIGAYSSASNPALQGLVYASAGTIKNSENKYVGSTTSNRTPTSNDTNNSTVVPVVNIISSMNLNLKGSYLTNLALNTNVTTLKNKTSSNITVLNSSGNQLGNTENVGTGSIVKFNNGESYPIVVYGDLTGDGIINSADLLRMRQYLIGKTSLSGAYLESARLINTTGSINSADLLRMRQYLLGQKNISQS